MLSGKSQTFEIIHFLIPFTSTSTQEKPVHVVKSEWGRLWWEGRWAEKSPPWLESWWQKCVQLVKIHSTEHWWSVLRCMCDDFDKQLQETKQKNTKCNEPSMFPPLGLRNISSPQGPALPTQYAFIGTHPAPLPQLFPQFTKHISPLWQLAGRECIGEVLGVGEGKRDGISGSHPGGGKLMLLRCPCPEYWWGDTLQGAPQVLRASVWEVGLSTDPSR